MAPNCRYRLPLFASDRSKWYEQISVWERDIGWLMLYNNRYYHSILKDVYESGDLLSSSLSLFSATARLPASLLT